MLRRKMVRDILQNKIAYIACAIVIAIGLMVYTAMSMAKDNLLTAKDEFYAEYRLADAFANVKAMPYSRVASLQDIDGIAKAEGRLVKDVKVVTSDRSDEDTYLRLISLPDDLSGGQLNGVKLLEGSYPENGARQVLLADKFYVANELSIGGKLDVIIEGKQVELSISGSGQSPEYVYALKDALSIAPDPVHFEVAYVSYKDMEQLFTQDGIVNDLSFALRSGWTFDDVEQKLKTELKKYELESLYAAKDQTSNAMLSEELNSLQKMAGSLPIVFLGIAAIIIYIMLKRLVESQRGQIGTMKAFGYGNWRILTHYLSYGLLIGAAGGILGGLLGSVLAFSLTQIYQVYFGLPNLTSQFNLNYFLTGMLLSICFCLAAAFQGARGVLRLKPAEAMLPPAPVRARKTWLDHIPGFWRMFNVQGRMAVRNGLRNKGRSMFTLIGMVFTFSMMASFFSLGNMSEMMIMDQFTKVQKQDVKITFTQPMPLDESVREMHQLQGVRVVEAMLEAPVSLRFLNKKEDVVALGIPGDSKLYHVFDKHGNRVSIPKSGLMLSEQVAKKLDVRIGDELQLESAWAKEDDIRLRVERIIPQYLGSNIYLDQATLLNELGQGKMATSVLLSMDPSYIPDLKEQYRASKVIGKIEVRQELIDKYDQLLGSSAYTMWLMAVMAAVTGFAIVYNSSIISLAERQRELASLRVMGMTPKEVMEVISVEQWMIGIAGIIAGIPLAFAMNQGISKSMSSDLYTLPDITGMDAILQAFLGTILAIWVSQLGVARKIKRLNLVEVLKERD